MANLEAVLKSRFGFDQFLFPQKEVISEALAGGSSLVIMPTGGGKSLCYQFACMEFSGTTLVVSPLIALMKDQVDAAKKIGIRATFINSSIDKEERGTRQEALACGQYQLLFVTPERFLKSDFLQALKQVSVPLMVVDEAHCISQWGHDFRPEYAKVGEIRKYLSNPPVMALTATATVPVQKEICEILDIKESKIFKAPIERLNLHVKVLDVHGLENKVLAIKQELSQIPGPKIIYASLIQSLYGLGKELEKHKMRYSIYHGQLPERERSRVQDEYLKSEGGLLLATPAFGLGINKPNVRAVFHLELPNSLEAYFQEIGRAGRDGERSDCILLYDEDDVTIQMDFLKWSNPEPEFIERVLRLVEKNEGRVKQEGEDFLRAEMNFYNLRDFRVETSLNLLRSWGVLDGWAKVGELTEEMLAREQRARRLKTGQEKLLSMVRWVNSSECRMLTIYKYLGFDGAKPCGKCDLCLSGH